MGNLSSKQRSNKASSSAVQAVTLCDQFGVPVRTQKISDSFVQKGTVTQTTSNITALATRTELCVATAGLLRDRRYIIKQTWETAGLTLDQGGVRLSTWRGLSEAVKEYCGNKISDYVGFQDQNESSPEVLD